MSSISEIVLVIKCCSQGPFWQKLVSISLRMHSIMIDRFFYSPIPIFQDKSRHHDLSAKGHSRSGRGRTG